MSRATVVLTGVASLVAGAFSMGTGEFISVTNQNELVGSEVRLEKQMLSRFPAAEEEELAGYFRGFGADGETAARMAAAVMADPDTALRVHTRHELGVDPEDLPSPLLAGVSSLLAFSAGAIVPLLPYLFSASPPAYWSPGRAWHSPWLDGQPRQPLRPRSPPSPASPALLPPAASPSHGVGSHRAADARQAGTGSRIVPAPET